MVDRDKQNIFKEITLNHLSDKEKKWVISKTEIIQNKETAHKFAIFFSMAPRFINADIPNFSKPELASLNYIYPGFNKSNWNKIDMVRTVFMYSLPTSHNKEILSSFFEASEMNEQVSLYKGLYLLKNASEFSKQVEEGIRTNMANVFDAIAAGNPFANTYLEEDAWNQLILKAFFMVRPLHPVQFLDDGKNEKLGNMLQEYVKERWSAGREVSPEIWRMIDGYLEEDIKDLISQRNFEGIEKKAIAYIMQNNNKENAQEFWEEIGKSI